MRESEWERRKRRERERAAYAAEHGDVCGICGVERNTTPGLCGAIPKRAFDEDHDHKTGVHRGFICARSNKQLYGWITPAWLRATADYLERTTREGTGDAT